MTNAEIQIHPVIAPPDFIERWPWAIAPVDKSMRFWPISRSSTDAEVGLVVARLAEEMQVESSNDATRILHELLKCDRWQAEGGLAIAVGDEVVITPGCCSGLEDWRGWWLPLTKRISPDLGHDPAPWTEFLNDETIRIWEDGGNEREHCGLCVDLTAEQLKLRINAAHHNLHDFLQRLDQWLTEMKYDSVSEFVTRFDGSFEITCGQPTNPDGE